MRSPQCRPGLKLNSAGRVRFQIQERRGTQWEYYVAQIRNLRKLFFSALTSITSASLTRALAIQSLTDPMMMLQDVSVFLNWRERSQQGLARSEQFTLSALAARSEAD